MTNITGITLLAASLGSLLGATTSGVAGMGLETLIPAVGGLAAAGYALVKMSRTDQNWEGLIAGLREENARKDERINALEHELYELKGKFDAVQRWERDRTGLLRELDVMEKQRDAAIAAKEIAEAEVKRLTELILKAAADEAVASIRRDITEE